MLQKKVTNHDAGEEIDYPDDWEPVDMVTAEGDPERTTVLRRQPDGTCLFYPNKINGLFGSDSTAKSMLLTLAIHQELTAGHRVMMIDFEDNSVTLKRRLGKIGPLTDEQLRCLDYRNPKSPVTKDIVRVLADMVASGAVTLCVVDSLGEAFAESGVDEDRDTQVGQWFRANLDPLADAGAAVVTIDHSTKSEANPLHPSGSKRKRAKISGALYLAEEKKGKKGDDTKRVLISCAKDRYNTFRRDDEVAMFEITNHADGTLTVELNMPPDARPQPERAPKAVLTSNETAVLKALKRIDKQGPVSFAQVLKASGGKRTTVQRALGTLMGSLLAEQVTESGHPNGHLYRSLPGEI